MRFLDLKAYDEGKSYGCLLPAGKRKVLVMLDNTADNIDRGKYAPSFFTNMIGAAGMSSAVSSGYSAQHLSVDVPTRTPDCGAGRQKWASKTIYKEDGHVFLQNTQIDISTAWLHKSGKDDEPEKAHVRDHIWNVQLHGAVRQHFLPSHITLLPESNQEFGYEFDYLWRLPRMKGDVRKVPMLAAEVEGMHLHVMGGQQPDSISVRVSTADGYLRFDILEPWTKLPRMEELCMDTSREDFYGVGTLPTSTLNRLTMTAIIYALMKYHGMSRKAAFAWIGVKHADVYPVMDGNFYTFDNYVQFPSLVHGDRLWDRKCYKLHGEDLFDGTASDADVEAFKGLTGSTWEYLQDVQAMFALDEPLDSTLWYGGVEDKPDWRLSVRTCGILSHYLYGRDDVAWNHNQLKGENQIWNVDWTMNWQPWTSDRNNHTDFILMQRLGVIPFLPRLNPQGREMVKWEWLSSWRRRLFPTCAVIWDKLEHQQDRIAKLSKEYGEEIKWKELKKALEPYAMHTRRSGSAVFVLGVMELTPLSKDDVRASIQNYLGTSYREY